MRLRSRVWHFSTSTFSYLSYLRFLSHYFQGMHFAKHSKLTHYAIIIFNININNNYYNNYSYNDYNNINGWKRGKERETRKKTHIYIYKEEHSMEKSLGRKERSVVERLRQTISEMLKYFGIFYGILLNVNRI